MDGLWEPGASHWKRLSLLCPAQDAKRAARAALRSAQTHAELAAAVSRAEALGLATEAAAGKRKLAKMPGPVSLSAMLWPEGPPPRAAEAEGDAEVR